jgi:hypothetical protein
MTAIALSKFTQGLNIGADGEALKGTTGSLVSVANSNNTDVASWQIDLLYVDPASSLVPAAPFTFHNNNNTPIANFTPDVRGCYRFALKVWNVINRVGVPTDIDQRVFAVPEANGIVVPPPQLWPIPLPDPASGMMGAKPNEFNFGGQLDGWAGDTVDGLLNHLLRRFRDAGTRKVVGSSGPWTTNQTGPYSIGMIVVDPTEFPGASFYLEAVIETTNAAALSTVELWNLDDAETVTGSTITTAVTSPTRVISSALTVGGAAGNLRNALRTYEVRLYRNGGTASDFVGSKLVQLSIV